LTTWLHRLREHVQSGNRDGFDRGMEWVAEHRSRPQMPSRYERTKTAPDRKRGEPDWSLWRCPECRTEQTGDECSYCRRESVVADRHRESRGNMGAA
jgi:hypothetical protein